MTKILIEKSALKNILSELEGIAAEAECHPLYLPDTTAEELDEIGGDAAFVTADVAWPARSAIEKIEQVLAQPEQSVAGYCKKIEELIVERDNLREALAQPREIEESLFRALEIIAVGDAKNPQAQAAEELVALGYWRDIPEARALAQPEPVAWLIDNDYTTVFFDIADVHRSKGKKVEPLYTAPPQPKEPEQEQESDYATIAGLETSVGHLSAIVDEQRAILVEVERVFGVDDYGAPLEDGESKLIDQVRAHIADTTPPQPEPVPVTDNTYGYAKSLAEAIFKQHFSSDEHYASGQIVWGVNDTVIGILTQIDNMVADMVRRPAQPEQEPWVCECGADSYLSCKCAIKSPPQRKPLTDEVKHELWIQAINYGKNGQSMNWQKAADFYAKAIETAHGIQESA